MFFPAYNLFLNLVIYYNVSTIHFSTPITDSKSICLILSDQRANFTNYPIENFRHWQPFYLLFASLSNDTDYALHKWRRITKLSRTITVLISSFAKFTIDLKLYDIYPSNLFVIYNVNTLTATQPRPSLRLLLWSNVEAVEAEDLVEAIEDPVAINRRNFRMGHGEKIASIVFGLYPGYFSPEHCGDYGDFGKLRYDWRRYRYLHCSSDLMLATLVGTIHNLSVSVLNTRSAKQTNRGLSDFHGQFTRNGMSQFFGKKENLGVSMQTLFFLYFFPKRLLYCKRGLVNKTYVWLDYAKRWTRPFSEEIWLFILIAIAILPMYALAMHRSNPTPVLTSLGSLLGQSANLKRNNRLLLVVFVIGLFLAISYGNELTSIAVVIPRIFIFQSVKEFLADGYKVLWFRASTSTSDWYKHDLMMKGVLEKDVLEYFRGIGSDTYAPPTCEVRKILDGKFALIMSVTKIVSTSQELKRCRGRDYIDCYPVPDDLMGLPFLWEIHTKNRNWIKETLERTRQTGLMERWNEWAKFSFKLLNKYEMDEKKYLAGDFSSALRGTSKYNNITKNDLDIVIVVGLACLFVSLVVFMFEIFVRRPCSRMSLTFPLSVIGAKSNSRLRPLKLTVKNNS